MNERRIRVLVVDDSAYIRKVMREMLTSHPDIEVVGTARDGREALDKVAELQPDVVTLDLMMPNLDGLGFLREQMKRRPLPVVVVSIATEEGDRALAALDAGAIDFIQKPTALATERVFAIQQEVVHKVLAAANARLDRVPAVGTPHQSVRHAFSNARRFDVVALGLSTGGPQALRAVLPALPADFPVPLLVVVHMPVGYTQPFAERLDQITDLHVTVPFDGEEVRPGTVYLAEAGMHLRVERRVDGRVVARRSLQPLDTLHRPSVDVLLQSAAQVYNGRTLAVVLTGMGEDGLQGAAWVKAAGGMVLAESEQTAVVYGMPRAVIEAGLADRVVNLPDLPATLMNLV